MKKNMIVNVKGIKCDHCDWKDMNITVEDYMMYLNKPCPICGHNLLTKKDYQCVQFLHLVEKLSNILPKPLNSEMIEYEVKMNGKDNPIIEKNQNNKNI